MFRNSLWEGVRGLVLDAVGTLITPAPSVADVYAEAARRQGIMLDRAEVRAQFHRHFQDDETDEARSALVTDEAIEYQRWRRIVARVLPELPDPERGFTELWTHFGRPDAWRCDPDIAPVAKALRDTGLVVRIASNFDARLRRVLAGLDDLAEICADPIISSEVGYRKPHPAFYQAVCARLDLPPDRVLCVGDDLENDVLGAGRAGLRGVLLDRSIGNGWALDEDVTRIARLTELLDPRFGWPPEPRRGSSARS